MDILMACVEVLAEVFPGTELLVAMATKYLQAVRHLYSPGAMDVLLAEEVGWEGRGRSKGLHGVG